MMLSYHMFMHAYVSADDKTELPPCQCTEIDANVFPYLPVGLNSPEPLNILWALLGPKLITRGTLPGWKSGCKIIFGRPSVGRNVAPPWAVGSLGAVANPAGVLGGSEPFYEIGVL